MMDLIKKANELKADEARRNFEYKRELRAFQERANKEFVHAVGNISDMFRTLDKKVIQIDNRDYCLRSSLDQKSHVLCVLKLTAKPTQTSLCWWKNKTYEMEVTIEKRFASDWKCKTSFPAGTKAFYVGVPLHGNNQDQKGYFIHQCKDYPMPEKRVVYMVVSNGVDGTAPESIEFALSHLEQETVEWLAKLL